ncbi:hypothetical protein KO495_05595 [Colwellia sp. D2M02]|uniref:hypothetical protein n=1 Tax=Colwellia sp. D2M02 TaxID=2841562 RepID=UPI001C0A6563|nr:hypothetical protein [Colwellia sp. D2M02]MBU2892795.1 hypothetical protein [Colwellia sp. D2M02]
MASDSPHQTYHTRQVQRLLSRLYARSPQKDTLLDRAIDYFEHKEFKSSDEKLTPNEEELAQLERTDRYSNLLGLCLEVIELVEGDSFAESNRKSAQVLGTIQLLCPTEGKRIAASNEMCKPLYKAVLALRLLDHLIIDGQIVETNILKYIGDVPAGNYKEFTAYDKEKAQHFLHQIKVPIVMAALLQDIGNFHPKAQEIIYGPEGNENPFRTLEPEQRKALLQINYRETIYYISEGIGIPVFAGNTKAEREQFKKDEKEKLNFIQQLIKSSVKPRSSIGNILKVPQIYTSIVLSTKSTYNYKLLPQVYQVLNKNAELGACSQNVVDALYQITGMFPQGFGIVYMPFSEFGGKGDCYEYAIVNSLYPKNPDEPHCRMTTRKLAFIGFGHDIIITKTMNLYFTQTAKKLASLSKERLNEILELLSSNAHERKKLDILPRCWHAKEYFSIKSHQKIWNKSD